MDDKDDKLNEEKEKKEIQEIKENIETKEESGNENETKENTNIIKEKVEENKDIITDNKLEEKKENIKIENTELNNNDNKEPEKEEIKEIKKDNNETENIIIEKEKIVKKDEIIINNNENKNDVENKESENNNINNNEESNNKKEENNQLKNKVLNEKNIEEMIDNDNEPIINNEEKENSEDEDEPEYSKNDIEALYLRTKTNKTMKIEQFYEQKRHYFIMTEGGTPIYSRYGDEIKNCSLLATFSAIITKFTIFNNEKNSVFIALSNKTDSISFLYSQLELLYQQLLSIVTSERMPILEEKPSSCSTVLSGINESLEQIIEYSNNTMVGLLNSYQVLPIENRQKLNNICHKYLKNALLCCLITPDAKEIISLSKSNIINISFNDINPMFNNVK